MSYKSSGVKMFLSKVFVPQYRKTSLGKASVFHDLSGIRKYYEKDGRGEGASVKTLYQNLLFHSAENFRSGAL